MINGMDVMRRAVDVPGDMLGQAVFHDCFLTRVLERACSTGSLPAVLVSSDRWRNGHYPNRKHHESVSVSVSGFVSVSVSVSVSV